MQIENLFQNKAKEQVSKKIGKKDFEIRGPDGEPYYYMKHNDFEIFIHDDSLQIFGPEIEVREEIQDHDNDDKLLEYFMNELNKIFP